MITMKLAYVSDATPGFSRRRYGKGFAYFNIEGQRITDEGELKRIASIGVPPAYKSVWICPLPHGHLQATGIDDRGRKQYRYHTDWRRTRDENKFANLIRFGEGLTSVRRTVDEHMSLRGLPREKLLATVVMLLDKTLIRVGNAEYAKTNNSYGLTTLRKKHIDVEGHRVTFEFLGKSGKKWNLSIKDRRIAAVVKRCSELPGYDLFKYLDEDGQRRDISSSDVNAYLKEISSEEFTAKDFRTWAGTVRAAVALRDMGLCETQTHAKKNVVEAVKLVARQLGNTPAICRKCYIHPGVLERYLEDSAALMFACNVEKLRKRHELLSDDEIRAMCFLKELLESADSKA